MKIMLTGIFLAASAAPASIAAGFYAFKGLRGGFPAAIETSATVAAVLLGLAFFVFMSGLVAKPKNEGIAQAENSPR
ncbi:hypothetical protein HBN76_17875 [Pseudomonas sp. WS 5013]|uniref:hypothetical protein n=1 Tax=Pseudomonas sp. WS 5013 TaxID=2717475 RepID=UPI001472B994|nr:hypothetical protein [Pseudomonas sp. WS 5013]NMY43190.1 hypothetical protein [Pseudomonas sp. WS 5013]